MAVHQDTWSRYNDLIFEICIRTLLVFIFVYSEYMEPFHRKIQPEEIWLYKNPKTISYVPTSILWPMVVIIPLLIILLFYFIRKDRVDSLQGFLSLTLALGLNGVLTNLIKVVVGRPRPDFFWRCFPDGQSNPSMICTGDKDEITEGLKSFPSGHSSFAFCSLGFTSLYIMGKLQVFTPRGRGHSWRLILSIIPLASALVIALSRTCDYHHHWQDVLAGSLLGSLLAWLCYRQHYPSVAHPNGAAPYALLRDISSANSAEESKLMDNLQEISVKWI